MHEETQAVAIRRRRSRAECDQLVAEYEASGLSRIEFCRKQGLSLATLARYRRRLARAQGEAAPGNGWLAVELSSTRSATGAGVSSGLAVALPCGGRIEVQCGFDPATLAQLLGVLERF